MNKVYLYVNTDWFKASSKRKITLASEIFSFVRKFSTLIVKYLKSFIFSNFEYSINSLIKRELVHDHTFSSWNAAYLLIRLHSLLSIFNQEPNRLYLAMLKGYKLTFNCPDNSYLFNSRVPCVFSKIQASERNLLICFSGHNGQFNMPIPIFHSIASKYFTDVMYFNGKSKDFYIGRENEICDAIRKFKSKHSFTKISSIGTSGGAHMPIILTNRKICTSSISCSPALKSYNTRSRHEIKSQPPSNRLFYCSTSAIDKYEICELLNQKTGFAYKNIIDLASISDTSSGNHATLYTLVVNDKINNELSWLAGS